MPKKKDFKLTNCRDFTINDSANAPKPFVRIKKALSQTGPSADHILESEPPNPKTKIKKKKSQKPENDLKNELGIEYPEIIWYLISLFIKPEDIGNFARINKSTYYITKRESFWVSIYKRYCANNPRLPKRLRIENGCKIYGLRQRVIRALYHTYNYFIKKAVLLNIENDQPHKLVKRRCVNVWYKKEMANWQVYFKFKKVYPQKSGTRARFHFIEELEMVDANSEEDSQLLQVTCVNFYDVPPIMGLTLSSVNVTLSEGFGHHRLRMGFSSGNHVTKNTLPECSVVLDTVKNMMVYDWWHPNYPHFDNKLPSNVGDEESVPVLMEDFFSMCDGDF